MPKDLQFLTSPRFWVLVAGCVIISAQENFSLTGIAKALEALFAGFITIKTVDRFGEQSGGNTTGKST